MDDNVRLWQMQEWDPPCSHSMPPQAEQLVISLRQPAPPGPESLTRSPAPPLPVRTQSPSAQGSERWTGRFRCRDRSESPAQHSTAQLSTAPGAQKNERESIRQKLALGSFFDDGPGLYSNCTPSTKPCVSSRKQSSSCSDRDVTEDDSESLDDSDFLSRQRKLQAEAKMALAMAKPMARMQVEVERQIRRKSPVADLLPHLPHISECLMKRSLRPIDLRDMSLGQLQVIVNDLHSQIESLNEELVEMLVVRDELHVEQDAMLVDIEDLTRHAQSHQKQVTEKMLTK
ncbi:hypothetical protein JZ751_013442 [Albula glossodonta]|uniref:Schwannomin interacting protein 1 C-terminal domain-containing protein n=1 Tax=Albula glossodonta TaxID=121402 RepID=A0A8T2MYC5_9TELE|nr:hypothetical protein JZ751_013442 [Albula glossodonta]